MAKGKVVNGIDNFFVCVSKSVAIPFFFGKVNQFCVPVCQVTDEALATQSANGNEKRWVPESNTPRGIGKVTADAVGAIVGALYFDQVRLFI